MREKVGVLINGITRESSPMASTFRQATASRCTGEDTGSEPLAPDWIGLELGLDSDSRPSRFQLERPGAPMNGRENKKKQSHGGISISDLKVRSLAEYSIQFAGHSIEILTLLVFTYRRMTTSWRSGNAGGGGSVGASTARRFWPPTGRRKALRKGEGAMGNPFGVLSRD